MLEWPWWMGFVMWVSHGVGSVERGWGWVWWFRDMGEVIRRCSVRGRAVGRVMDSVGMMMGGCDGLMVMDGWVG